MTDSATITTPEAGDEDLGDLLLVAILAILSGQGSLLGMERSDQRHQLREDAHRYRETNGVQILATLRSLAMNTMRLDGFWSITEGVAALANHIPGLLALLGWQEPAQALSSV